MAPGREGHQQEVTLEPTEPPLDLRRLAGSLRDLDPADRVREPRHGGRGLRNSRPGRLLILEPSTGQLLELWPGTDGRPDPAALTRSDVALLGVQLPRGMTLDPSGGRFFVLDAAAPRIAIVEPDPE
jgi:hypothetical protein